MPTLSSENVLLPSFLTGSVQGVFKISSLESPFHLS